MGLAIEPEWVPKGHALFTPATAEDLSTPDAGIGYVAALAAGANVLVVTPSGAGLYFTTDGVTPASNAACGYIPVGVTRSFANMRTAINLMKWVQTGATTTAYCEWYQAPGG